MGLSHDQDGCYANIWQKPFKNLLQNQEADCNEIQSNLT